MGRGRPRTPIGTYGSITTWREEGKYQARTRYRFEDGVLRPVQRSASTKAGAIHALKTALLTIKASQAAEVKREMSLTDLADRFLYSKRNLALRSQEAYRQTINHHIKPKIGNLVISEATTERLQRFVDSVREDSGPGAAKACKAVLSGMMGLASRSDAVATNPVRDLEMIAQKGGPKGATAIPLDELKGFLHAVRSDEKLQQLDATDVIVFMLGTGCRISEAMGVMWSRVDLDAGTVTIDHSVIRATGHGLTHQDFTKTGAGTRTIALPAPLIWLLGDRRIRQEIENPFDLVFPTVMGKLRDPRNTSRAWREARQRLGLKDYTSHSFRKTVATLLDQDGLTPRDVAEYLGHANPSMTMNVYMAKNTGAKKAAQAMSSHLA